MLRAGRRNARRDFCNVTHCIASPMQERTQWTHSDVWSQLPTTPECSLKIGEWQSEKKRRNCDRRAICNGMGGIEAGRGVIHHRGVLDSSDGAILPRRKYFLLMVEFNLMAVNPMIECFPRDFFSDSCHSLESSVYYSAPFFFVKSLPGRSNRSHPCLPLHMHADEIIPTFLTSNIYSRLCLPTPLTWARLQS